MDPQHRLVQRQFEGTAASYATSATHNDAAVLADLVSIVRPQPSESLLDIASGPGTVALAFAPYVRDAVALDLTPSMIELAGQRAREAGLSNLQAIVGTAEDLPFTDAQFDIVTVRTAPHHFSNITKAVDEMRRVLKPNGRLLVVDTSSPEDDELDLRLNAFEKRRDPSHVRNYRPSEWRSMLETAGFEVSYERVHMHALGKRLMFDDWTSRMLVSPEDTELLRRELVDGPEDLRALLDVQEEDGLSFTLPEVTILAFARGTK